MSTLLDIIFASFLGGTITLITLNANMVIRQTWTSYNHQVIVQNMLISTAQILEGDLRNMGCGVDVATETVTQADSTSITFKMALRPEPQSSSIKVIQYYAGPVTELSGTTNPLDRWLYRKVDGVATHIGMVTQFSLKYMDDNGVEIHPLPITDPDDLIRIRIIEITMEVQSPFAVLYDPDKPYERYASALWKQTRLASQNFNR
jgi:hypothetical protein